MAGEYHKDFRLAIDDGDQGKIEQAKSVLDDHLNEGIERACFGNFEYIINILQKYRGNSLEDPPRVCLKVNYLTHEVSGEQRITSLYASTKEPYHRKGEGFESAYAASCRVDDNTSSEHVYKTGEYHHCGDIPKKAVVGKYKNPRFNQNGLDNYSTPYWVSSRYWGTDKKWLNVWAAIIGLLR